jgi:menaquinone-9 beta-reductase
MGSDDRYDVVIVGGGPAGSTSAFLLGSLGYDVLLIDQHTFPRSKLCGGLITHKTLRVLERVFLCDLETLYREDVINFESDHFEGFDRSRRFAHETIDPPFHFVDRAVYDEYLLKKAKSTGITCVEGERVTDVEPAECAVHTSCGERYQYRYLIGADGVHSIVRRHFPEGKYQRYDWNRGLFTALEVFIARRDLPGSLAGVDHPALFFNYTHWGYAWLFPNRERVILGLGRLNGKDPDSISQEFSAFVSDLGIEGSALPKERGWVVPYGNAISEPAWKRIALVGDAGGFADPIYGEGIFYAHRTGELAARAIDASMRTGENFERTYLASSRRYVLSEISCAKRLRNIIYPWIDRFPFYPVEAFFFLFQKYIVESIHGDRSYRWFRRAGDLHERV